MQLCECDVSLQKVRIYRDCAEVLLSAKPVNKNAERTEVHSIDTWKISLGSLNLEERESLRVLSPHQTLLHLEWVKESTLLAQAKKPRETTPAKPLSLPPPKRGQQHRTSKERDAFIPLTDELRESTAKVIEAELRRWADQTPSSVESIKRSLAVTESLLKLQERWRSNHDSSSKIETLARSDFDHKETQDFDADPKDQADSSNEAQSLCLYFQTDRHSYHETHGLPKALQGAWIDSVQPQPIRSSNPELSPEEEDLKDTNQEEGVWLRLLLKSSCWHPSTELSLNGDNGRLNLYAELESKGLSRLMSHLMATHQSVSASTWNQGVSSLSDTSNQQEIECEWINDHYYTMNTLAEGEHQSRQSRISFEALMHGEPLRICFESLSLMSRSLRDFASEREVLSSAKRLATGLSQHVHSEYTLGYFTRFISYRYPLALVSGDESALCGRAQVWLCLPPLLPFFNTLISLAFDNRAEWRLVLEGQSRKAIPTLKHQQTIVIELGTANDIIAERSDHGLIFSSHRSQNCRIGVMSTDGNDLIDEIELQGLGIGALKQLDQTLATLNERQEAER